MSISAAIGRRIRTLRMEAGVSPRQLAKCCGLRATQIIRIEEGQYNPSLAALNAIARKLGVPTSRLIQDAKHAERPSSQKDLKGHLDRIGRAIVELPDESGNKLDAAEAAVVRHAMMVCGGNKSAAARLIGVERKALERRWTKLRREAAKPARHASSAK